MSHKPQNTQSLKKAFDHERNNDHPAYRPRKTKSIYLWGRKKGSDLISSEDYRDGWDRIFGKGGNHGQKRQEENQDQKGLLEGKAALEQAAEPSDFDAPTDKKGRR